MLQGAHQAEVGRSAGAAVLGILAHGLAQQDRIPENLTDVVGHLIGLTKAFA